MQSPRAISLFFLILLLGVSSFLYYPRYIEQRAREVRLKTLLSGNDAALPLGARSKSENCVVINALPDRACTPGAVLGDVSLEQICASGFTKTIRNVPVKLKKVVYAEYGVSYPQPHGSYEVDHLIPLAIGGSNDIANLFLEPANPAPGFREKDLVEVYLREEVCAGRVVLRVAQERIAGDWLSIYKNLSLRDIARLKAAYHNWSN